MGVKMRFDFKAIMAAPSEFRYEPDTYAGRLERVMKQNNVHFLGTFVDNGRLRSIDLTPEVRAWRTLWTKDLSMDQLEKVHAWELKKFTDRLAFSWEAQDFLGMERKEYLIKKNHLPILIEFNNGHRPVMDRVFKGLSIPPYFIDDLEFDGMEYQQSWDKCVWYAELPSLPDKAKRTVTGAIAE